MRLKRRTTVVLALGTAQTLAWGSTYYLPAILAAPIARELGMPTSWIFAAFSSALLISAFLGPVVGRHIDRHGGRGVLAGTNIVFAVGLVALGCAHGLPGLVLAWLLLGVGMGAGLYDAAFAALTSLYGRNARGPITGITLIAGFASTICWPITAALDAAFGWRTACLTWAIVHLVLGLPLNLLLGAPVAHATKRAPQVAVDTTDQRRATYLMAFVFAAAWFVTGSMAAHLPRLLQAAGTTATAAIAASALVGPAQVAARVVEFGLLRRAHPLVSARIAASTHPIGALAFALAGGGPIAAGAFALLHGAGNGLLTIARGTLPLAVFGPAGYGQRTGWISAPARATQAVSPFVFSMVLDAGGPWVALMLSSGMTLAAFAGLMLLRTSPQGAGYLARATPPR